MTKEDTRHTTEALISTYKRTFIELVEAFVDEYYMYSDGSKPDYHIIGIDTIPMMPGPIEIADMYWSIDEIYEALLNNFEKQKVFKWWDHQNECHAKDEKTEINFYNFCKYDLYKENKKNKL